MKFDKLLIDGKNNTYRAVFAGLSSGTTQYLSILVKCILKYIRLHNPSSVHIMWDHEGLVWRSKIYGPYKATRELNRKKYIERFGIDPNELVKKTEQLAIELFKAFGFYQYSLKYQEADDLIYTFCEVEKDSKILIVSSDYDLAQISHRNKNVSVINPLKNKIVETGDLDPVEIKCLQGDKSDNIRGFKGIGPKKAQKLVENEDLKKQFLDEGDGSRWEYYNKYKKIIDLSENPFNEINDRYVRKVLAGEEKIFNMDEAITVVRKSKQQGLLEDLPKVKKLIAK